MSSDLGGEKPSEPDDLPDFDFDDIFANNPEATLQALRQISDVLKGVFRVMSPTASEIRALQIEDTFSDEELRAFNIGAAAGHYALASILAAKLDVGMAAALLNPEDIIDNKSK